MDKLNTSIAKKIAWALCHKNVCDILQYIVASNNYNKIKHYINLSVAWDLLAAILKFWGIRFFNNIFRYLNKLILKDCNNTINNIIKFQTFVNKFYSFSSEFKMHDNFFIYKFQSNLGFKYASYFEKYI